MRRVARARALSLLSSAVRTDTPAAAASAATIAVAPAVVAAAAKNPAAPSPPFNCREFASLRLSSSVVAGEESSHHGHNHSSGNSNVAHHLDLSEEVARAFDPWARLHATAAATAAASAGPSSSFPRGGSVRSQAAAVASRLASAESVGPLLEGTPWTLEGALAPSPQGQARLVVGAAPPFAVVHANAAAAEMLELPGPPALPNGAGSGGSPCLASLMGPGTDPSTCERLLGAVATRGRAVGECVVYGAGGEPRYVMAQVSPLMGRDGSRSHALLLLRAVVSDEAGLCDDEACFPAS